MAGTPALSYLQHWCGSKAEANSFVARIKSESRQYWKDVAKDPEGDYVYKPSDVVEPTVEPVDFPTKKKDFIEWLNLNFSTDNG
jgi:hypothetical protein